MLTSYISLRPSIGQAVTCQIREKTVTLGDCVNRPTTAQILLCRPIRKQLFKMTHCKIKQFSDEIENVCSLHQCCLNQSTKVIRTAVCAKNVQTQSNSARTN
jgi:hypothetical protein